MVPLESTAFYSGADGRPASESSSRLSVRSKEQSMIALPDQGSVTFFAIIADPHACETWRTADGQRAVIRVAGTSAGLRDFASRQRPNRSSGRPSMLCSRLRQAHRRVLFLQLPRLLVPSAVLSPPSHQPHWRPGPVSSPTLPAQGHACGPRLYIADSADTMLDSFSLRDSPLVQ